MPADSNPENNIIEIGEETFKHLNVLRRWTMFLSVSGFIVLGLIITLGLITGTFLTAFNNSHKTAGIPDYVFLAAFIVLTVITFFPVLFLFRFSKHTAAAVSARDRNEMKKAIKYLKRYFIFIGITLIIIISVYIISLILEGTTTTLIRGL